MKSGFLPRSLAVLLSIFIFCSMASAAVGAKQPARADAPEVVSQDRCMDCHKSLGGRNAEIVDQWAAGVHSREGRRCNLCHKGDDAVMDSKRAKSRDKGFRGKPSAKEDLSFCGRRECHELALQQFRRGPHYDSVMKKGAPSCVSCHGSHNIQRSSINILSDKTCTACHSVEYSREIISSIFSIEKELESIENDIDYLKSKNAEVEDETSHFARIKSLFHQIVHVFSREEIQFARQIVALEIESLKAQVQSKVHVSKRIDIIYITTIAACFMIVFGIAFYVFWMLSRRSRR